MSKNKQLRGLIYGKFDSESECAKKMGWDRRKLNKITNGDTKPSISDVYELATCLGTTVDFMARIFL